MEAGIDLTPSGRSCEPVQAVFFRQVFLWNWNTPEIVEVEMRYQAGAKYVE
jgi:hypothetical protein